MNTTRHHIRYHRLLLWLAVLAVPQHVAAESGETANQHSQPFQTVQRDGTQIILTYYGDHVFNWYEDNNGFTVVQKSGDYRYATLDANGRLTATDWLVGHVDPLAVGLTPGILPTLSVIETLHALALHRELNTDPPDSDGIPQGTSVIQGDILILETDPTQPNSRMVRGANITTGLWTNGIVPYEFDANVVGPLVGVANPRAAMREAMDALEAVANVSFIPRSGHANYLHIQNSTGNSSYVGMIGGGQPVNMYNWNYTIIMAHELSHALGMWHEQSRSDRDTYVQINVGYIQSGYAHNFDKIASAAMVGIYDFDSMMHYGKCAFSTGGYYCTAGTETITVKAPNQAWQNLIGQRTHISTSDAATLVTMYGSPGVKAAMTDPANNGDTLDGASHTLTWDTGTQVDEYALWVGTAAGTKNIYNSLEGTNTSKTVTGLPIDGSTVYVRLFSSMSGVWQYTDYNYVAATITPVLAAMTDPADNGDTLDGTSHPFAWDIGTGVSEYAMWVGTTGVGSKNIYTGLEGTNTSKTVTGLPNNATTVYVRLFSKIGGTWQQRDYAYVASGTAPIKAAMTDPADNGDTLSGMSYTFTWDTGTAVTQYALWFGSTGVGSKNIYTGLEGTNTSKTITTLPINGCNVYVRLFSRIGGTWLYTDYQYVAATITPVKAAMTDPADNGDTLDGTSHTFEWDTGTGVPQYGLSVGTTGIGSKNLYTGLLTATSKTLTNLPNDARTVYVRLYSKIGSAWQYTDYTYTASGTPPDKAEMTSPADNGDTLDGTSHAFTWDTGTGVSSYAMWVGTTGVASKNIYNAIEGTNTSKTVTGLPTNGSAVYVRLFSKIGTTWLYDDYQYVAADITPVKAAMTDPADNGDALSGTSYTFTWDTGTAVTQYALWFGTTGVASKNLYTGIEGTNTSKAMTNLPTSGTVYVRLFSKINGAWQYTDYAYTAHE